MYGCIVKSHFSHEETYLQCTPRNNIRTGICHSISLSIPFLWASSAFLKNAFAPILRRFGIVNTLNIGCKRTNKRAKSQINYGLFRVRVLRMSTNLEDCTFNLENFP